MHQHMGITLIFYDACLLMLCIHIHQDLVKHYMYVCMHAFKHYMYVCMHACMHACMYVCMWHVCMFQQFEMLSFVVLVCVYNFLLE